MAKATKEQYLSWAKQQKADLKFFEQAVEDGKKASDSQYKGFDPAVDTLLDEKKANQQKNRELDLKIAQTVASRIEK